MQFPSRETMSTVDARVVDVLPQLGLAYVVDDEAHSWGVTRSTTGGQFNDLSPGCRVRLKVQDCTSFSVVRECELLG